MPLLRVWGPFAILLAWSILAMIGPIVSLTPNHVELEKILLSSDSESLLGYDDLGRPIFDRLMVGARTSFLVAICVVTASGVLGLMVGLMGGYLGGITDHVVTRLIDVFLAFPGILLAIALAAVMGPGIENIILALAAVGWVGYARLARAQVLSIKEQDYVVAAQALGSSPWRIMSRHLAPLVMAPLLIEASFGLAGAVVAEAGLSFLGLGVQPPEASWGSMIRDGTRYMLVAPHMVLVPGLTLMLVVLAINVWGDWFRDWLDVKTKTPI